MIEELARQLSLYGSFGAVVQHRLQVMGLENWLYALHLPQSDDCLSIWDAITEAVLYVGAALSAFLKLQRHGTPAFCAGGVRTVFRRPGGWPAHGPLQWRDLQTGNLMMIARRRSLTRAAKTWRAPRTMSAIDSSGLPRSMSCSPGDADAQVPTPITWRTFFGGRSRKTSVRTSSSSAVSMTGRRSTTRRHV